jgi:tetratricopeptide (TPR) repeat protein
VTKILQQCEDWSKPKGPFCREKGETMMRMSYYIALCCALMRANAMASDNSQYLQFVQQGRIEYRNGRFLAAETSFIHALHALEPSDVDERAGTLTELGSVFANEDKLSKAEQVYIEALTIYKQLADGKKIALLLRHLGAVYSLQRRDDDALRVLNQALKLTKAHQATALEVEVLNSFGVVYYRQGKHGKAAKFFNRALNGAYSSGVPADFGELLNNLGNLYQAEHKYKEAEVFLKQALKRTETEVGPLHPDLTFTLASLGGLYTVTGRYADAEDQYQRALKILQPSQPDFDTRVARLLHALGASYARAGKKREADAALARAAEIARLNLAQHVDMAAILEDYSASLNDQGKRKEAEELRVEAKRARMAGGLVITAHQPF